MEEARVSTSEDSDPPALADARALLRTDASPAALAAAQETVLEFLAVHPANASAHHLLACVLLRLNRYSEAEKHFLRTIELAPDHAKARWMLVRILVQRTEWEKALQQIEVLVRQYPDDPDYLNLKAHALLHSGEYEGAISCFEALVSDHSTAEHWMFYGFALATVGNYQEAIVSYCKAIALKPDLGEAYWSLSNLKTFRFDSSETGAMRKALDQPGLDARNRWLLHFALGKAFEDAGDYRNSFEQYKNGNTLFRRQLQHSADKFADFVQRSKALFTPEFFRERAGSGNSSADPIFIVGLPRSGSTLIEQILASHSMVEGTKELTVLNSIAMRGSGTRDGYPEILRHLKMEELRAAGDEYIARTRSYRKLQRPFFIDKAPANFHHLGLLHLILPNAKIIDARRHPLGCGFAVFRQYFPQAFSFAFDLAEIGRYYRDYVELMAHFDRVLPGRIHRLFYERMITDPEREIRSLLEYCELPFEESCLRFYDTKRAVLTPSAEQVRQPIFTDGLEQWRHYESWLAPLQSALGDVLTSYPDVPKFDRPSALYGTSWTVSVTPQAPWDTR
ncbi:MAG TPA: sulfotransferase [Rhizomicrobium sp.]|jgi:tetratricopeptide (TPR) repeat protein|nr:sulfotransferase [Rhizomicrobium sp.]